MKKDVFYSMLNTRAAKEGVSAFMNKKNQILGAFEKLVNLINWQNKIILIPIKNFSKIVNCSNKMPLGI